MNKIRILFYILLILGWTSIANADPITLSALLVGQIIATSGFLAGGIISGVLMSFGMAMQLNALFGWLTGATKSKDSGQSQRTATILGNFSSSNEPYHVVYGKMRVGSNRVFVGTAGTNNKYLNVIYTLSHSPCDSLDTDGDGDIIWLDDKRVSYYQTYKGLVDLVDYTFHSGAANQAAPSLITDASKGYTSVKECLRNICYLEMRFLRNQEAWSQLPTMTCVLKGRKLYDPRDGSCVWSDNGALVWLDWMTNRFYGGNIPYSLIDLSSVMTAANLIDTYRAADPLYPNEKVWHFNGVIFSRKSFSDNLQDIEISIRAGHYWSGGKYYLKILSYDTPAETIKESDVASLPDRFNISQGGIIATPGRAIVYYSDALNNYVEKSVPLHITGVTGQDLNFDNPAEYRFVGLTDEQSAIDLASFYMKRARASLSIPLSLAPKYGVLDPGDTIQLSHSFPAWSNQLLRVQSITRPEKGLNPTISFVEESSALYDGSGITVEAHSQYKTTLPGPNDVLDAPLNPSATTGADTETSNQADAYLLFKCDHMGSGLKYEFRYRKEDQTKWKKESVEDPGSEVGEPTSNPANTGTLNLAVDGEFSGTVSMDYQVEIEAGATTFKWRSRLNAGPGAWSAYTTAVTIDTDLIDLDNDIAVNFNKLTGGIAGDIWDWTVTVEEDIRLRIGALPCGTKYFWGVRTVGDKKQKSPWAFSDTPSTTWAPSLPTMAGFTPTVMGIRKGKSLKVDLSAWEGFASETLAAGVKVFEVYYSTTATCTIGGDAILADTRSGKDTSYTIVGLSPGTKSNPVTYYVRVRPIGWSGNGTESEVA